MIGKLTNVPKHDSSTHVGGERMNLLQGLFFLMGKVFSNVCVGAHRNAIFSTFSTFLGSFWTFGLSGGPHGGLQAEGQI